MNAERTEARLARPLSRLLLAGLSLAIALMLAGAILAVVGTGTPVARESSISGLPAALAGLEPGGFFDLGLLVLLATPVARVVALLVGFARYRMWLFSGVSLVVLALLALSAFLGLRAG
jgi:uncharacterized membrane protein